MTSDAPKENSGLSRRTLLRSGLLAGAGTAAIVAASAPLAGRARAGAAAPALADTPAASAPEQHDWAWCDMCQGMFFTNSTETTRNHFGNCPFEGDLFPHANVLDYTSSNYGFYYNATGTDWQEGWYWCSNCQGMFWAGSGRSAGACPYSNGDDPHDGSGSYAYVAYLGPESGTGQGGWRWCRNCSGMFWANGHAQNGTQEVGPVCPVNGGLNSRTGTYTPHDDTRSSNYYIPSSGYLDLGPPIMV